MEEGYNNSPSPSITGPFCVVKWKWNLLCWCQLAYKCVGAWMVASSRAANYQRWLGRTCTLVDGRVP
jgi:hypothetical protein